jgi:triosephosphate isomerase
MKHIYVNLKRFDVPREIGGVNDIAPINKWAAYIIEEIRDKVRRYNEKAEFTFFFPEMHLINALEARETAGIPKIGCQSVYSEDVKPGENFGTFTTERPAAAIKALGCDSVLIGHCEERNRFKTIMDEADTEDGNAVNRLLNKEIKNAIWQGMEVLYCVGEKSEEQDRWEEVLSKQLDIGLEGVNKEKVVIAYEPIWSIGPGKVPANKEYITKIARYIKSSTGNMQVVYGGGLKKENAQMLAAIPEIDGGLIALTRFQGDIGFYPGEYLEILEEYLGK